MDLLTDYAKRPVSFLLRYVRQRKLAHGAILFAVVGAVSCSVSTQYGVKFLVDTLSVGPGGNAVWIAFGLLVSLIAADNLLWRLAGWIASHAFVGVTGDLRSELFRHLTGHAPSYFSQRLAGTLTGRITATSNAAFAGTSCRPALRRLAPSPTSPSSASRWHWRSLRSRRSSC
jgi:ATP-binding cassette, subfamily B, bacterial